MDELRIPRLYGDNNPKRIITNEDTDFVKVETELHDNLTPAEEYTLYVLRLYFNGYSASQGAFGDMMDISSNRFSANVGELQKKGYVKIEGKHFGRGVSYKLLKEPKDNWAKIPKSFIKNHYIDWKDRFYNIKLYNLILWDVNEIHYQDKEIALLMGISEPTFRLHRDTLKECGVIEKLPKTITNPAGGYRIDVCALLGLDNTPDRDKPIYAISSTKKDIKKNTKAW